MSRQALELPSIGPGPAACEPQRAACDNDAGAPGCATTPATTAAGGVGRRRAAGGCRKHCTVPRALVTAVLASCIGFLVVDSLTSKLVGTAIEDFIAWVARAGPIGPVVFVLVYFVGTVLFVPGSVLTIGSGFAFAQACGQSAGVVLGSAVVLLGAVAGDTAAFLLGRYALRPLVAEKAAQYRILAAVDRALEKQGFKMVVLLRLSPVIPFNAFNYLMGVTRVGFVPYALGSVGLIPGTIGFVYIGSLVSDVKNAVSGDASNECPEVKWTIFALGCAATVAAISLITVYARRELRREVALAKAAAVPGTSTRVHGAVGGKVAAAYSIDVGPGVQADCDATAAAAGDLGGCVEPVLGRPRHAVTSASTTCSVDVHPAEARASPVHDREGSTHDQAAGMDGAAPGRLGRQQQGPV